MTKLCYTFLVLLLLTGPILAQDLSREEALRLEVLQLKQQLKQARQQYVDMLVTYGQCVQSSFTSASGPFDEQLRKAYQAWLKDIEQNHPDWTWDGQKLIRKPVP